MLNVYPSSGRDEGWICGKVIGSDPIPLSEAAKLGFKRAVLPAANMPKKGEAGIELFPVQRLDEALEIILQ